MSLIYRKPIIKVETHKINCLFLLIHLDLVDMVCLSSALERVYIFLSERFNRMHSFMSKRPSSFATSYVIITAESRFNGLINDVSD